MTRLSILCALGVFVVNSSAGDPCRSGPQVGQRPGPYSFVVSTGDKRGVSHCYICDTKDHPAVVIFARSTNAPLGNLVRELDRGVAEHKASNLRAWVTFLNDDQPNLDDKLVKWGQEHAIRLVPLGVFEDAGGPPSYRLARDAEVTIIFFVKQQVIANYAFRTGELNDERVVEVMKSLPRIVDKK